MSRALGLAVIVMGSIAFGSSKAHARKFDFKSESIATYLRGTYGNSQMADKAYGASSGDGVSVDKSVATNSSGEVGILFSSQTFNIRLGAELLMPRELKDIKGTNASGTEYFNLHSKVMALVPMANFEILAYQTPTSRLILGGGAGIAFVTLDNTYTMTADGTTALGGITDFVESASSKTSVVQGYLGYEFLFTDTVTMTVDLGYRYLPVPELKSTKDTTAISGTQTNGGGIYNMNEQHRNLDLGGVFAGISLRFYIGI